MKKLILLAASLVAGWNAVAQFSIPPECVLHIQKAEATTDDYRAALLSIGIEIYNFVLPVDTLPAYNVIVHKDEYRDNSRADSFSFHMGPTSRVIPDGENQEISFSNKIRIISNKVNPDKPGISIELIGSSTMTGPMANLTDRSYASRPFEVQPFETGRKIPLVLFGSFWVDENGHTRFCGSDELDAGMQDEIFRLSPHYYIISVELLPVE